MMPALFEPLSIPGVTAIFTDRSVDFTLKPDAKGLLWSQAIALNKTWDIDPQQVYTIRQVHEARVLTVTGAQIPQSKDIPLADGVITNVPGIALTVRSADCLSIFIYDPKQYAIGLLHAGWRGTQQQILAAALGQMRQEFGSQASDIMLAFGPAIGPCCYEVGEEFLKLFPQSTSQREGQSFFDIVHENIRQAKALGVEESKIRKSSTCTRCQPGFFSYRREKEKAGRHLSIISLNNTR